MKAYLIPLFVVMLAFSSGARSQQITAPQDVRVEGLEQVIGLLQRIDDGISRLAHSRWEYEFIQRNRFDENLKARIEAMGRDGWELVNVTVEEGYIFKRRVTR